MLKIKLLILYATEYSRTSVIAILSAIIVISVASGCGYRLNGINGDEQLFSPSLKHISVEGIAKYDVFRIQLNKDMAAYRMHVVAPQLAKTRLIVTDKKIIQHAITIGDDAKVREYLLAIQLDFYLIVNDKEGIKRHYSMQSIHSETTYTYYPQHISIAASEKERALNFLYQEISSKLINRLRTLTKWKQ